MPRVQTSEIQAWLEPTKLTIAAPDLDLLVHLERETLVRLAVFYDTSGWTDHTNTPDIVRTIISKCYAVQHIDKTYSENQDENSEYARRLKENVHMLIEGILEGVIPIPGQDKANGRASFFPTNASSAQEPTRDDMSLGGPWFSLGKSF